MVFQTPPRTTAEDSSNYVIRGTACVIGSTTTTIKTPNGVEHRTTSGCAFTTVRGGGKLVKKTGHAITSTTSQAITIADGWSKKCAVDVKESVRIVWRRMAAKMVRKSKNLPKLKPLPKPKQLLTSISNKAMNLRRKGKKEHRRNGSLDFGDGGLWQRTIIMGDKCEPLDFSGVIYYDNKGHRTFEIPTKSPRRFPSDLHDTLSE